MTMSWPDVYTVLKFVLVVAAVSVMVGQCRKPNGWIGGRVARAMNIGHASLTRWGLGHIALGNDFTMLDVGCGGGKLIDTLASIAPAGRLFGIDYSRSSVETARATNAARIAGGRVDIRLVTAFETHYYWPDLPRDVAEIARVLKPGGIFLLVAEAYRGQRLGWLFRPAMAMLGGKYLTVAQHRDLFVNAGFTDISVDADPAKGWISVRGTKAGASNVGEAYS
jgi:SAM-dependent methyltransferase